MVIEILYNLGGKNMDSALIAALIAAFASLFLGLINVFISIHKNKQDTITKYRMEWINEIRKEYSTILGWTWYQQTADGRLWINSINDLRNSIYKISLMLNIKDDYDNEVLKKTFEYLDDITHAYTSSNFVNTLEKNKDNSAMFILLTQSFSQYTNNSDAIRDELEKMVRVYLKVEWTRVKTESSILKLGYLKYWNPFCGFNSKKAIKKFSKDYKEFKEVN